MAKKFKFKLEGLLKIRKFKEEQLKVELGKINGEVLAVKNRIIQLNEEIREAYLSQEATLQSQADGQLARFFPYFIQAKREDIKNQENLLYSLEKKYQKKLAEVSKAMGESKVIDSMKESDKEKWRKERDKKEMEEIEEVISMRRNFKGHSL